MSMAHVTLKPPAQLPVKEPPQLGEIKASGESVLSTIKGPVFVGSPDLRIVKGKDVE